MKRVLMVATVPSMIGQFNMNNIHILLDMGYQVDVAADFTDTSVWPSDRIEIFKNSLRERGVQIFQLDFSRSPLKFNRHKQSYLETVKLIRDRQYSFIHTHTPIASAIIRKAAHKTGTKVIYTAHGFHFYDGAPIKNWMIFYPIEKHYSRYTDVLITINKEDYKRAKDSFFAKQTVYVPGVGVDTEKFEPRASGRDKIRNELGLKDTDILILSVGELNENKNHTSVIRALAGMNITYVIVGKGDKKEELQRIAKENNVDLRLTGFRNDIVDFYNAADLYVLPSVREGLNVSLMEAMASGLPVICGRIRGNVDLIDEHKGGYLINPKVPEDIKEKILLMINYPERLKEYGEYNKDKIKSFNRDNIGKKMRDIYNNLFDR